MKKKRKRQKKGKWKTEINIHLRSLLNVFIAKEAHAVKKNGVEYRQFR